METQQIKRKGGARPGAGRKKGGKNQNVLERERVLAALRQKAMAVADSLLYNQLSLARGQTFLYKIEKYWETVGKTKVLRSKKPKLVTSQYDIELFLEGKLKSAEENEIGDTYYFLTTKEPNNQAIDSILDRTFGRASQSLAISGDLNISKLLDEAEQK